MRAAAALRLLRTTDVDPHDLLAAVVWPQDDFLRYALEVKTGARSLLH